MLFVFLFHFFYRTDFHKVYIGNANLIVQSIFRWLVQICVPLFFMCTGYLQAYRKSSKKYYFKIFKYILTYLIICLITIFARFLWLNNLNGIYYSAKEFFLKNFIGIFTFQTIGYSWYIGVFVLIYLFTPLLNNLWEKLNSKFLKGVFIISIMSVMWLNLFGITMHLYPLLFYFLGKIIRELNPKKVFLPSIIIATIVLIIEVVVNKIINNKYLYLVTYFDNYGSILPVCLSLSFFLIFINAKSNNKTIFKCVKYFSCSTYETYLFAFIVDYTLYPLLLNTFNFYQQESMFILFPIVPIFSIVCSFCLAYIYRNIRRFLNKSTLKNKKL